jgi:prefoldin subunit 5
LKLSEKAKKLRNLEEVNSNLEASISRLQTEIADLKKLQPESRPARQGAW